MNKQAKSKLLYSILICLILIGGLFVAKEVYAAYTAPTVTLESPSSGSYDTDGNIDFNFSLTDASASNDVNVSANATLFINGIINASWLGGTAYDITNNTEFNITPVTILDGTYLWNVRVTNQTGDISWWSADNYTVIVDTTEPLISVRYPANNTYYQTASFVVDVEVNDSNPNTCNIYLRTESATTSGTSNGTQAYSNATAFNFTAIGGFANGDTVHYNVTCSDDAGNTNTTGDRVAYFDLADPVITTNVTNGSWFAVKNPTVQINFTVTDNYFLTNCSLWGDMNDTNDDGHGSGWHVNQTIWNDTQINVAAGALNFTSLLLYEANSSDMYRYNIQCVSASNRTAWATSTANYSFGVDKIAPTKPSYFIMTPDYQYVSDTMNTIQRWANHTDEVVTDATPYVVWTSTVDENPMTINVIADNDTISAADTVSTRVFSLDIGTNSSINYTEISLSPGRPYTNYYIGINVTDEAGNVNYTGVASSVVITNKTTYRLSSFGANLTGSRWNPIGVARMANITIASILNETSASYVAFYNINNTFMTCSSTSLTTFQCQRRVSRGNPVWIYTASNTSWDYSYWNSTATINPKMSSPYIDWNLTNGLINMSRNITASGSRWQYIMVNNQTVDKNFADFDALFNSSEHTVGTYGASSNLNWTGGNGTADAHLTFWSYYNGTGDGIYYPYYWNFGSPWNSTGLGFRDVLGVYLNDSRSNAILNRTGY